MNTIIAEASASRFDVTANPPIAFTIIGSERLSVMRSDDHYSVRLSFGRRCRCICVSVAAAVVVGH